MGISSSTPAGVSLSRAALNASYPVAFIDARLRRLRLRLASARSIPVTTKKAKEARCGSLLLSYERVTGIEPVSLAWEASVLPLYYTRLR